MASPLSFRTVRWLRSFNLFAQAVLLLSLFGGLNYLALHYGWRFDLTRSHRHSLSPETIAYLQALKEPVRVIVTLTNDSEDQAVAQAYRDVTDLLREYVFTTGDNPASARISVKELNVYQSRHEAEALGISQPNVILVLCGERRRVIGPDELYRITNNEKKAFLGEQALTAAILDVANPVKKKIYFLTGHGEMPLDDVDPARGLSLLNDELRLRNLDVAPLDLAATHQIPADTNLLVIAWPQAGYDRAEEELLRQYLSTRAGRVLALLAPTYPHGLDDLLADWGVLTTDVVVCDSGKDGQTESGDLILRPAKAEHPVTSLLTSNAIPVYFGSARDMRPDPAHPPDANLVVTPLIGTSPTAWGERGYRRRPVPPVRSSTDLPGPFAVVTASERVTARGNLAFSVPGGRLVAFGGADWIANGRLAARGNLSLFLAAVNWTVERDIKTSVPIRPLESYQLVLSQEQLRRMYYCLIFALPGAVALLGLVVSWTRRR